MEIVIIIKNNWKSSKVLFEVSRTDIIIHMNIKKTITLLYFHKAVHTCTNAHVIFEP